MKVGDLVRKRRGKEHGTFIVVDFIEGQSRGKRNLVRLFRTGDSYYETGWWDATVWKIISKC